MGKSKPFHENFPRKENETLFDRWRKEKKVHTVKNVFRSVEKFNRLCTDRRGKRKGCSYRRGENDLDKTS